MRIRPFNNNGDILPVLNNNDLFVDSLAVAGDLKYRLNFWTGEWWENPEHGNQILKFMESSRLTVQDGPAVLSYIVSYILKSDNVISVEDADIVVEGRSMYFSCRVVTSSGYVPVSFDISF